MKTSLARPKLLLVLTLGLLSTTACTVNTPGGGEPGDEALETDSTGTMASSANATSTSPQPSASATASSSALPGASTSSAQVPVDGMGGASSGEAGVSPGGAGGEGTIADDSKQSLATPTGDDTESDVSDATTDSGPVGFDDLFGSDPASGDESSREESSDATDPLPTEAETSERDGGMSVEPGGSLETGKLEGMTAAHNRLRAEVDTDEPLPPLEWSDEIAVLAQEWADVLAEDCGFEHSMRPGYGENLAEFGASQPGTDDRAGVDAVEGWYYSELVCYEYGTFKDSDSCSSECDQYGGCGHYTQVVWRETQRVGCGVASCEGQGYYWDIYVCNYEPPGNYIGEYPY